MMCHSRVNILEVNGGSEVSEAQILGDLVFSMIALIFLAAFFN